MKNNPEELIENYRKQIERVYGKEIAGKSEINYSSGWYHVKLAGSYFSSGKIRAKELIQMTENLKKREPKER